MAILTGLVILNLYSTMLLFMFTKNTESLADECFKSNSGVELVSSIETEGRTAACLGEVVVYTCSVANAGSLQWAVESFHRIEDEPILFAIQYHPVGTVIQQQGGLFIANVTDAVTINVYWGNITSTLSIVAQDNVQNKRVWCSNGVLYEDESPCILHKNGVLPSAPKFPFYTITSHDITTFSVLLEWSKPMGDGGVGISNYTTTLQALHTLHTYVEQGNELYLTLPYNQMHGVEIIATNCLGNSPPVYVDNLYAVSCGVPDLRTIANSSYSHSTHEGSHITFLCIDDEEVFSIMCSNNSNWTPDPSNIKCSDVKPIVNDGVYCKTPALPPHSNTDEDRNVRGSVITYQCDSDYEPTEWMVSVCSSTGEWVPNISAVECIRQVDCGVPMAPRNGSIYYTGTGQHSKAVIQCNKGLTLQGLVVSTCLGNGSWFPHPAIQQCSHITTTEEEQEKYVCPQRVSNGVYIYAITGSVVFFITLPLGALLGWLLKKYCRHRKPKQKMKTFSPPPVYEEVNAYLVIFVCACNYNSGSTLQQNLLSKNLRVM